MTAALACGDDDGAGTSGTGSAGTSTDSTGSASTGTASTGTASTGTASTGTASTGTASTDETAGTAATSAAATGPDLPALPVTLEQWSACVDGGPFSSNPAIEAACLDRCELDAPAGYGSTRLSLCEEPSLGSVQSPLLVFDSRADCEALRNPRPTNVLFDAQGVADLRCCCGYLRER